MEDFIIVLLSALSGTVAFFVGQRLSGKNKTLIAQAKWYEDELANMRSEIKRYRAKASYYMKGAVPSELAVEGNGASLVEGIISALPQNFRSILMPFKGEIMKAVADNPQMVEQITGIIKSKLQGNGQGQQGDQVANAVDSL